jgi:hypothetical protein
VQGRQASPQRRRADIAAVLALAALPHKDNPAARVLERRWCTVLKRRTIPVEKLNALPDHELVLSAEWMETQGGAEQGYEQLRSLSAHTEDGDLWRCEQREP